MVSRTERFKMDRDKAGLTRNAHQYAISATAFIPFHSYNLPEESVGGLHVAFWNKKNPHTQSCFLHFLFEKEAHGVLPLCPDFLEVLRPPATSMNSFLSTCHQPGRRRNGLSQDVSLGERGRWSKSNSYAWEQHGWRWVEHDGAISAEMRSWVMFDLILQDRNTSQPTGGDPVSYSWSPQTSTIVI